MLPSYKDRTIYTTWNSSLDYIKLQSEIAAKLLRLWAYFGTQDVWLELLQECQRDGPEWFRKLTRNRPGFEKEANILSNCGLVREHDMRRNDKDEPQGYSMENSVHLWTRYVVNVEPDVELARLALKCISLHVPKINQSQNWPRLFGHVDRVHALVRAGILVQDEDKLMLWAIMSEMGIFFSKRNYFTEAPKMHQYVLEGREKTLGLEHTSTLDTVTNLGVVYWQRDRLDKAEQMHEPALQGYEKTPGRDHTPTIDTVNNLGVLYKDQNKLDKAEEMFQRALQGTEKVLGRYHTLTLNTINNLGVLYWKQGRLDEAEEMYGWALKGREVALGRDHTSTLDSIHCLGILYRDQGKLDKAQEMYARALQGYEKRFGLDHPRCCSLRRDLTTL